MERLKKTIVVLAAVGTVSVVVSACGGGGNGSGMAPQPTAPSPPPAAATNFTTFMHGQATAPTTETAVPVDIESMTWAFTDEDNESAYDDVINAPN